MLTWMQRHKKWLVSTIWISTIAFVGAGFVGWGSYDFGKSGGAVAVVGDRTITIDEYQREYSTLYEQYAQIFGKEFNQEMADKLKLKDVAYKMAIEKNLILSYGDELGLSVTNEDIAKELVKYEAFIKDGKFDKDTYIKVLNRNGTTVSEFENSLKRNILLRKVEELFQLKANKNEVKALNELLFLEDNIDVKVLDINSIEVLNSLEEIKKYWSENKLNYMSDNSFDINYEVIALQKGEYSQEELKDYYEKFKSDFRKADDKIKTFEEALEDVKLALDLQQTKKLALKEYIKYKKDEKKFSKNSIIFQSNLSFGENNNDIINSKEGTLFKPFLIKNEYVIVKLNKKLPPKELSFEQAKENVTKDFINNSKSLKLKALSKKELANFKGKNIGWVNRSSVSSIEGLNPMETSQFFNQLFSVNNKLGEINLGNKVVLYKINDSRFATYDAKRDESVRRTLENLQNTELMTNLIKSLEDRYEIQSSLGTKE